MKSTVAIVVLTALFIATAASCVVARQPFGSGGQTEPQLLRDQASLDGDLVQAPVLQHKTSSVNRSVALCDGDLARVHVLLELGLGRIRNGVSQRHAQVKFGSKRSPQQVRDDVGFHAAVLNMDVEGERHAELSLQMELGRRG